MRRAWRLFVRAVRLRCPSCGGGPLFSSWFKPLRNCPRCGLRIEREEGYFTGAMALNLIVAEGLGFGLLAGIVIATWPHPPWRLLQWGLPVLMVAAPVAFYPFSKTLWLAFNLFFRPAEAQDIDPR